MLLRTTIGDKSIQWLKGQLGLDGWDTGLRRQPRGQIYFQGNTTGSDFDETYSSVGVTYTLDTSSAIQFAVADNVKLKYTGSASRWFNVIGTVDVEHGSSNAVQVSIKLAKNGVAIDASQCNGTIAGNGGVAKLHTMWILPLEKDDTLEIFISAPGVVSPATETLTPKRSRLQATCLS